MMILWMILWWSCRWWWWWPSCWSTRGERPENLVGSGPIIFTSWGTWLRLFYWSVMIMIRTNMSVTIIIIITKHDNDHGNVDHLSVDGAEPWKRPHATENVLLWRLPLGFCSYFEWQRGKNVLNFNLNALWCNLEELEDGHGKLCADVVEDLKTMLFSFNAQNKDDHWC